MIWLAIALLQAGSVLERADMAFRQGDFEAAKALALQSVTADPGAVHGHMILGVIAARNNQWDVSNARFQTVIRLDPSNPTGYFYLGQAKLYQRQWDAAIQYFTRAAERNYPDRDRLTVELAHAQNESGRPQKALEMLMEIAPPADPRLAAQYHGVTAFALGRMNQWTAAIEAGRQAVRLDASNPLYWDFLIDALIKTNQAPQALAEAIRAQRLFPDRGDTQYLFAVASHHVVESPLSRLALRNLRDAEPQSPRVFVAEGLLYRKQGKDEEAAAAFTKAARRGVKDAYLLLGIVHRENGDLAAAERDYRDAERLNPSSGQVALELGKLFLSRGELTEARTRLEKAVTLLPDVQPVHYQLGLLYQRLGMKEEAAKHLRWGKTTP
ncbi:MAG: tetratricopeptide repeat protein [Acidobacteria bacterium]|nr:tetratricopeptide repeat protein [Acidobacteriota bacterium]